MPLPFRSVKDIYDQLHGAGAVTGTLPEWSTEMNALSQSDLYNAGLQDNFIKDASVGVDRLLEATGIPKATGEFGAGVGSLVGNEAAGRSIGQNLPRQMVNFAPLAAGPWGLPAVAALSGAETYTNTGSPAAGILSGLTNVAMPGVAGLGERAVLRGMGAKYLEGPIADAAGNAVGRVDRFFPTAGQHVASFLGGQGAAAVLGEASSAAQAGLDPDREYHFSPSETALGLTLGQLPFAAVHLAGKVVGRSGDVSATKGNTTLTVDANNLSYSQLENVIALSRQRMEEVALRKASDQKTPIEKMPDVSFVPTAMQQAKLNQILAEIRNEKQAIIESGDTTGADKLASLDAKEMEAMSQTDGTGVMGESLSPEADRVSVTGDEHFYNPKTGYRIIKVADDVANREAGFTPGDLVGYSTKYEKSPVAGEAGTDFDVPVRYHTKGVKDNRVVADAARLAENPNLPLQEHSGLDQVREFATDMTDVKGKLEAVQPGDTEGLRQAIEGVNGVLQKHGYNPLTDQQIAQYQEKVGAKDPQAAVVGKTNDLMLRIAQKEAILKRENDLLGQYVKDPVLGPEIVSMYNQMEAGRAGTFPKALARWVADGQPGGIEGLRARALKAKDKGGDGAPKLEKQPEVVEKGTKAAADPSPDTEHVRAVRQSVAESVTENDFDNPDAAQWRATFTDGSLFADAKLKGFSKDEQVQEWTNAANAELARLGVHERMDLAPSALKLPAGGGFVHDLVPYDEATNKLGKHTLPKTGALAVSQFRNMGKEQGQLPEVAVALGRELVPEAFTTGADGTDNVNVPVLMKGLREKGPVVETHEYGMEGKGPTGTPEDLKAVADFDELQHNLETAGVVYNGMSSLPGTNSANGENWFPKFTLRGIGTGWLNDKGEWLQSNGRPWSEQPQGKQKELLTEFLRQHPIYSEAVDRVNMKGSGLRATSYYRQISPFDPEKYPVVRVDVVVPLKRSLTDVDKENRHLPINQHEGNYQDAGQLWPPDNLHENLPNTLGWAMVQFVPDLKTGETVMFVGEEQSRWGQDWRKSQEPLERGRTYSPSTMKANVPSHPLLPLQHLLVLKAAIAEAAKRGVTKMVVSDGETAMMTEGHDKAATQTFELTAENIQRAKDLLATNPGKENFYPQDLQRIAEGRQPSTTHWGFDGLVKAGLTTTRNVSQEGGMRLHYDTTLQSAMRSLTGDKGEKVEMGVHKNAGFERRAADSYRTEQEAREAAIAQGVNNPVLRETIEGWDFTGQVVSGSPVFRNPDGTPKSSVTGTSYGLSKAFEKSSAQGGFTLTEPSRAPGRGGADQPQPFVPTTPEEVARVRELNPESGAIGLVRRAQGSPDPVTKSLADVLAQQYPEALQRIKVQIMQMSHEGLAQTFGNREGLISLSHANVMTNDRARAEQVQLHEVLHGLTLSELDNPTKKPLVDELEGFRQRLISRLPEGAKSQLDQAVKTNWISHFVAGTATMEDLAKNPATQQILYGLLSNRELVTQGFTDQNMRNFMTNLSAPKKKGFGVFVDWVRRFIGLDPKLITDTELAHFTDITSRILQQGEWVSDFANFADRHFAQQGLAPALVREQSRKALEAVQSTGEGASPLLMLHTLATRDPITKEFQDARAGLESLSPEHKDAMSQVFQEIDQPQDRMDGVLIDHLTGDVPALAEAMDVLPEPVTKYLFARARDMKEVLDAVDSAVKEKNEGLMNIADPKGLRGPVRETLRALNQFLKMQQSHEQDRTRLVAMQRVAPDAFFDGVLSEPSFAPGPQKDKGLLETVGDAIGTAGGRAFAHFLEQPAQIARSNPLFAEWYSKAMLLNAQVRNMVKASMDIFGRSIDPKGVVAEQPSQTELNGLYKAMQSGNVGTALNKLLFLKQERGKESGSVTPLDYKDPEVVKLLSSLSDANRASVISLDNKIRLTKVAADQQTLHAMQQTFATLAARGVIRDSGLKMEPAVDAANKVFDAIIQGDTNPAMRDALLAQVQAKLPPDAFINLLKFTQNAAQQHQIYAEYLAKNSDWVSAQRNGPFLFEYRKGGEVVAASAVNKKDALQQSGGREISNWRPNTDEENPALFLGANATEVITRLRELEQNQTEMLGRIMDPQELEAFKKTSPIAQFERETNARQAVVNVENLKGRTLSRGASELPWFRNHIDWIEKNAAYWQRRLLRTQGETMLQEPGTAGTDTAKLIQQHMDELLSRDPDVARKIQAVAFTWSIGFNPATIIANGSQTFMRGVSELIRLGVGPIAAFREVTGAWKDYSGHKVGDKPYRTPEEDAFIKQAQHDGMIDATIFDSDAAAKQATAVNLKRVLDKQRPKTFGEQLGEAAGAYSTAGQWMFRHGERANNEVMLLSTYRTLKKVSPDMPETELRKQAYLVNASVNDVGGRANRPLGLYSGTGDFARTVAMTASSLQSYLLGSTFQLIRNLKSGLFRPDGLTPAEVFSARKAAVYQLAVQFAAAGTLGMPFVSGALALLNQAFPELEVNRKVRESVSSLLGGDSENGHTLTDMALSGVPSMMGWDFQSRLSAGNVLPGVSEYNGFQPEQLLGVPASLVTNWVNGARKVASGDTQGGYAFVPPAIRSIVKLATGDATRDYRGRPVLAPTPGETLGLALGFHPKRLSDANTADRMAYQSQENENRRAGQVNQQLAEQVVKGNFGTVRAALQNQIQSDTSYNPVNAVRAIARAAEEMTFPKDLRREGNVRDMDTRKQLLGSFSLDPSAGSEVQRLQFRQGIEQRLGLMLQDPKEIVLAQMMDRLRAQQPDATRASLRVAAEQMFRRTSASQAALRSSLNEPASLEQ